MRKTEVQLHAVGYGGRDSALPAVNVKVYARVEDVKLPLPRLIGQSGPAGGPYDNHYTDPEFTHEWVREHVSESALDEYFWDACRYGIEYLTDEAQSTFGPVAVWTEGRSGGWLVVGSLPEVESWDAIMLAKWSRFAKMARETANYVPESMLFDIYANEFEQWEQEIPNEY